MNEEGILGIRRDALALFSGIKLGIVHTVMVESEPKKSPTHLSAQMEDWEANSGSMCSFTNSSNQSISNNDKNPFIVKLLEKARQPV